MIFRRAAAASAFVVLLLGAWHGAIALFHIEPYLMPSPAAAVAALVEHRQAVAGHLLVTLEEAGMGLAVSSLAAVALAGVLIGSPVAERALLPFAIAIRSTPVVAVAPLITLIAGRGLRTSILCVAIVSFFPVLVNSLRGFRRTDARVRELMHVLGATPWQRFRYARLPFAVPYIFTGLRTASASAVLGAMLAEWLTGTRGLGYLLLNSAAQRELELLWAGVIVSTLVALVIFWLMVLLERTVSGWREEVVG
jgi:ABC-type nitrate/sulfonate/bicarbonate transport system permease component